ncbi:MAG: methyltransferase domain-containing protein [Candidatus Cloacimonetes bacterium]|nr:methyltransferase domain-containing protein [Candidatus Cloacimonadota bacterium]
MRFYDFPEACDLFVTDQFFDDCTNFYKDLFGKKKYKDFLDCAVGTGQMLIPLAQMGFNVTGTDINQNMIKKATYNFAQNKLLGTFHVCDFKDLKSKVRFDYDCVLCSGNSLGHVKNEDIPIAIQSMDSVLRPGGMIYIDSKNWDNVQLRRQRFYLFNPVIRDRGRVNYVQVWDYNKDASIIVFNYLIFEEIDNKIVSKRQYYEIYYPFKIGLVLQTLEEMNYKNIDVCKLGDTSQKDLEKIEWYAITAEKPIEEITPKVTI